MTYLGRLAALAAAAAAAIDDDDMDAVGVSAGVAIMEAGSEGGGVTTCEEGRTRDDDGENGDESEIRKLRRITTITLMIIVLMSINRRTEE